MDSAFRDYTFMALEDGDSWSKAIVLSVPYGGGDRAGVKVLIHGGQVEPAVYRASSAYTLPRIGDTVASGEYGPDTLYIVSRVYGMEVPGKCLVDLVILTGLNVGAELIGENFYDYEIY